MQHLFLLLFLWTFTTLYSQEGKVKDDANYKAVYRLTYQPNAQDKSSVTSEMMRLYVGNGGSRFMSKGKDLRDSLTANASLSSLGNRIQQNTDTKTDFKYVILKDRPNEKISYQLQILGDYLQYEEELDLFEWEIHPDSKTVHGYQAQKATTSFSGREYTAWFTSQIPIPDGPYKFNGLPGLILDLSDSDDHYVFELISFEELKSPVVVISGKNFISTSKKKLLRRKREFEEDPFTALENNNTPQKTVTIHMDENTKQKMLRKTRKELAKRNNPIELE